MAVGYSGTPLAKKLGIEERSVVFSINAPDDYLDILQPLPPEAKITDRATTDLDIIHIFTNSRTELQKLLSQATRQIKQDGSIWVSWYKKAAKLSTEITEDSIREAAFPLGLVDIKVCAVDDKWSGLKLVIRKENRV
jgi:hypothetical protein